MELFDKNGCLTDEGLQALQAGGLDELGRLETAEHLSYCDKCMDRYTALLTADAEHMGSCRSGRCGGGAGLYHVALRHYRPAAEFPAGAAHMDTGDQPEPDRRSLAAGQAGGR